MTADKLTACIAMNGVKSLLGFWNVDSWSQKNSMILEWKAVIIMISGSQLQLLRLSSGQSQAELAKKLGNGGYDAKIVSAIENDRRKIGLGLLADWADACGYSVNVSFQKHGTLEDESISDVELPVDFVGDL